MQGNSDTPIGATIPLMIANFHLQPKPETLTCGAPTSLLLRPTSVSRALRTLSGTGCAGSVYTVSSSSKVHPCNTAASPPRGFLAEPPAPAADVAGRLIRRKEVARGERGGEAGTGADARGRLELQNDWGCVLLTEVARGERGGEAGTGTDARGWLELQGDWGCVFLTAGGFL